MQRCVQVGKDKMWPLEHNSEISFAGVNKKVSRILKIWSSTKQNEKHEILSRQVYVFMSSEPSSDVFPSELTSKYTVNKS